MAGKKRTPSNQLIPVTQLDNKFQGDVIPTYDELTGAMITETTGTMTDYVRKYIGVYDIIRPRDSQTILMNDDPVLLYQTYQMWAQYDLYWYLEQDTHVRSVLTAAKVNVASMPERIKPYLRQGEKKPSATSQAQADFIHCMFDQMEGWQQHKFDLLDSIGKGFSFSEIIWMLKDGYWVINDLMNRPQRRIQFDAQTRQPRVRTIAQPFWGFPVPPGKYIVHRNSATWENPFGDALDQSIYWMWLFKKMGMQFFLKHLEVGAASVPIVQHPTGAGDKLKNEALEIAAQIRNGAYGRLPENFKIIWAEAKNAIQNAEVYEKFINLCNAEITKCVKGQTLTTEGTSAGGHGSRGMGKTHQDTETPFDTFRAKALSASINKYLIRAAIDYNFANVEGYPQHIFEVEEEENLKDASEVLGNLTKALPDYDIDIREVNEKFGYTFTKKEKQEELILPAGDTLAAPGQQQPGQQQPAQKKEFSKGTEAPLYIMRHGKTALDPVKKSDGWIDLPLSDEGQQSTVQTMVDHLRSIPVKKIYAAPFKRTKETAEILKSGILSNPGIKITDQAKTWDLGKLAGDSKKESKSTVKSFLKNPTKAVPGGESYSQFTKRFDPMFEKIQNEADAEPDKPIVLILSGSNCRRVSELLFGDRKTLDIDESGLIALHKDETDNWTAEVIGGKRSDEDIKNNPEPS